MKIFIKSYARFIAAKIKLDELKIDYDISNDGEYYVLEIDKECSQEEIQKLLDIKVNKVESNNDESNELDRAFAAMDKELESATKEENKDIINKLSSLRVKLNKIVKGQEIAINKFISTYFSIVAFSNKERKGIKGSMLFAGPPGVGKTLLATSLARELKKDILVVNMAEYSDKDSTERFRGFDKTWKNSTAGYVTSYVNEHPDCILVLDEVDRAHPRLLDLILQLYNTGEMLDPKLEKNVSFKDVILIYTTNAGKAIYEDENTNISLIHKNKILDALRKEKRPGTEEYAFSNAIISRFSSGEIVMFNNLDPYVLSSIAKDTLEKKAKLYHENNNKHSIKYTDVNEIVSALLYSCGGKADARNLVSVTEKFLEKEVFDGLNQLYDDELETLKTINFKIDNDGKQMLEIKGKAKCLLFADADTSSVIKNGDKSVLYSETCDLVKAKEILRKDVDFALIDVETNIKEETDALDLEDIISDGRDLIDYILEYHREVPIYILCKNKELDEFDSLINIGAKGIVDIDSELKNYKKQIKEIKLRSQVSKKCYKLSRTNKALSYKTRQYFDNGALNIELYKMKFSTSYHAEDNDFVMDFQRPNVKFKDVIGSEDAKKTLTDFIRYLNDPIAYISDGTKAPRGVLLYGPPGTGKTLLAKALAGEARDCAFIQKTGSDFVGKGIEEIEGIFKKARKYAPAIIFVDEIDAIATERNGYKFTEPILNKLLTELDGFSFDPKRPVLFVAATNLGIEKDYSNQSIIDPAFVRRMDRQIKIDLPNKEERIEFIKYYLNKHSITNISEKCIVNIASRAVYYSPANLENLIEHAIRFAAPNKLTDKLLTDAFDANKYGEKTTAQTTEELENTAIHEAGHALVGFMVGRTPTFITIISRSNFGGYVSYTNSKKTYTKKDLLNLIASAVAGRAAEVIKYGLDEGISTGASVDFENATEIARDMICEYGMGDWMSSLNALGGLNDGSLNEQVEVVIREQFDRAIGIINDNIKKFNKLVKELIEKNSLTESEILEILA